jgi:hypothetical protein
MKIKLLLLLFIITSIKINPGTYKDIKIIKKMYGYMKAGNYENKRVLLCLIEYEGKYGFKIENVYILTDKDTFIKTINKPKTSQKWFIYVLRDEEVLGVYQFIWTLAIYNYDIDYIEFVFTSQFSDEMMINHIWITFDYNYIRSYVKQLEGR